MLVQDMPIRIYIKYWGMKQHKHRDFRAVGYTSNLLYVLNTFTLQERLNWYDRIRKY